MDPRRPLLGYPLHYPSIPYFQNTLPFPPPAPAYHRYPGYVSWNAYRYPPPPFAPVTIPYGPYAHPSLPLNTSGSRPLMSRPPPLLPVPSQYAGYYLPPTSQQNPVGKTTVPPQSTSENQSSDSSPETSTACAVQSSDQDAAPSDTNTTGASRCRKIFKFSRNVEVPKELMESEMLIRGYVHEFDDNDVIGYLKSGSSLKIEISKEVLYIMGRKVNKDEKFSDVLARGTNIKAYIAKKKLGCKSICNGSANKNYDNESDASYTVVLAWFGEIPDIKGLLPLIEEFEDSDTYGKENEKEKDEDLSENWKDAVESIEKDFKDGEGSLSSLDEGSAQNCPPISHIHGYIWWADKNQGIMRIYQSKGWDAEFIGVHFTANVMHFEGRRVECEMLHYLVAHLNKCDVVARKMEPKRLHGMMISWEAQHIECGQLPLSWSGNVLQREISKSPSNNPNLSLPCALKSEKSSSDLVGEGKLIPEENIKKPLENVTGKAEQLGNVDSTEWNHKNTKMAKEKKSDAEKLFDEKNKENDLYLIKDLKITSRANEFTILHNKMDFLSLIPSEYGGKHLTGRIVKLFSRESGIGIAQWKSMEFGCVNIIFKQNDFFVDLVPVNRTMQLSASFCNRSCNLFVLPIEERTCLDFKIRLVATCGWLGAKPSCIPTPGEQPKAKISLLHLKSDANKSKGNDLMEDRHSGAAVSYNSLDDYKTSKGSPVKDSRNNAKKKSKKAQIIDAKNSFSEDEDEDEYLTGEVIDVYCNMGKLMTEDQKTYYFSRDQCVLFGLSLCLVELWHILINGQKIQFTLAGNSNKNAAKIEKVFIGSINTSPSKDKIKHIVEWCENNSVPDCAKDILVAQLMEFQDY